MLARAKIDLVLFKGEWSGCTVLLMVVGGGVWNTVSAQGIRLDTLFENWRLAHLDGVLGVPSVHRCKSTILTIT